MPAGADEDAQRSSILVIDDEDDIVDLLSLVLTAEGYTVFGASGGHEGFALLNEERPDLVLVDAHMPLGSGPELIQKARAHAELEHTPFLLMSALEPDDGLDVAWVRKPFDVDELLERIRQVVENIDSERSTPQTRSGT